MTNRVAWAILSTARINRNVIPGARASEKVELLGVASRDERRAREYADEWGLERAWGSYEEMLADDDVEAVYISLPNSLHCEWSTRALEAGKHVLCEKPLSPRAQEVEAVFDTADRVGRLMMEAFMYRHNPQTRRLRDLVEEGAIGRLQALRASFSFPLADAGNVRMLPELEGGSLMDVGCYCVSGSRLLAGEPERVYGEQVLAPTGVDERFTGTLRFPGDVLGELTCGFTTSHQQLEAIGTDGVAVVPDPWHCRRSLIELRRGDEVEEVRTEPSDSYRLELENLSDAIRGEAEPLLGRADAVGQATVIEALYRSAETGGPVTLGGA